MMLLGIYFYMLTPLGIIESNINFVACASGFLVTTQESTFAFQNRPEPRPKHRITLRGHVVRAALHNLLAALC